MLCWKQSTRNFWCKGGEISLHEALIQGFHIKGSEGENLWPPYELSPGPGTASQYTGNVISVGCCSYAPQVGLFTYICSFNMLKRLSIKEYWFLTTQKTKFSEYLDNPGTHTPPHKCTKWCQSHPQILPFSGSDWNTKDGMIFTDILNKTVWN